MKRSFPYIDQTEDLPDIDAREDLFVDFKGKVDGDGAFERGKDIVSFANASGGVLIIGAAEDKARGVLSKWIAYTDKQAQEIVRDYTNVGRDICSPQPFVLAKPIPLKDGSGFVVAVNVRPHVNGQAIFVRGERHPPNEKPQVDVWACFRWIGDQNLDVPPTELPMLMLPQLRRAVNLLRSIPDPRAVVIYNAPAPNILGNVITIDEDRNLFEVKPSDRGQIRAFPLDGIDTVYAKSDRRTWAVVMRLAYPP